MDYKYVYILLGYCCQHSAPYPEDDLENHAPHRYQPNKITREHSAKLGHKYTVINISIKSLTCVFKSAFFPPCSTGNPNAIEHHKDIMDTNIKF